MEGLLSGFDDYDNYPAIPDAVQSTCTHLAVCGTRIKGIGTLAPVPRPQLHVRMRECTVKHVLNHVKDTCSYRKTAWLALHFVERLSRLLFSTASNSLSGVFNRVSAPRKTYIFVAFRRQFYCYRQQSLSRNYRRQTRKKWPTSSIVPSTTSSRPSGAGVEAGGGAAAAGEAPGEGAEARSGEHGARLAAALPPSNELVAKQCSGVCSSSSFSCLSVVAGCSLQLPAFLCSLVDQSVKI